MKTRSPRWRRSRLAVLIANPAQIEQSSGLKHADDKSEADFLAELPRLGIRPTGHIYDLMLRPMRDLLRRRLCLGIAPGPVRKLSEASRR